MLTGYASSFCTFFAYTSTSVRDFFPFLLALLKKNWSGSQVYIECPIFASPLFNKNELYQVPEKRRLKINSLVRTIEVMIGKLQLRLVPIRL